VGANKVRDIRTYVAANIISHYINKQMLRCNRHGRSLRCIEAAALRTRPSDVTDSHVTSHAVGPNFVGGRWRVPSSYRDEFLHGMVAACMRRCSREIRHAAQPPPNMYTRTKKTCSNHRRTESRGHVT